MEDRSSMKNTELTVQLRVGRRGPEVRLTSAATALRATTPAIDKLVNWLVELDLPPDEFALTVGVALTRTSGWSKPVALGLLPAGELTGDEIEKLRTPGNELTRVYARVYARVKAYELVVSWKFVTLSGQTLDVGSVPGGATIAVSWVAEVFENPGQDRAAFRSRIRWLMTELMLARYGVDSYREDR